ncbi:MAG: GAF domain-containing protein [Caldilineaceae bacterium]
MPMLNSWLNNLLNSNQIYNPVFTIVLVFRCALIPLMFGRFLLTVNPVTSSVRLSLFAVVLVLFSLYCIWITKKILDSSLHFINTFFARNQIVLDTAFVTTFYLLSGDLFSDFFPSLYALPAILVAISITNRRLWFTGIFSIPITTIFVWSMYQAPQRDILPFTSISSLNYSLNMAQELVPNAWGIMVAIGFFVLVVHFRQFSVEYQARELAEQTLVSLATHFKAQNGYIRLLDGAITDLDSHLTLVAAYADRDLHGRHHIRLSDKSITTEAILLKSKVIRNDLTGALKFAELVSKKGWKQAAAWPLWYGNEIVGTLSLYWDKLVDIDEQSEERIAQQSNAFITFAYKEQLRLRPSESIRFLQSESSLREKLSKLNLAVQDFTSTTDFELSVRKIIKHTYDIFQANDAFILIDKGPGTYFYSQTGRVYKSVSWDRTLLRGEKLKIFDKDDLDQDVFKNLDLDYSKNIPLFVLFKIDEHSHALMCLLSSVKQSENNKVVLEMLIRQAAIDLSIALSWANKNKVLGNLELLTNSAKQVLNRSTEIDASISEILELTAKLLEADRTALVHLDDANVFQRAEVFDNHRITHGFLRSVLSQSNSLEHCKK